MILISVDDHIIEPPDMFKNHLAKKYLDVAPQLVHREDGLPKSMIGCARRLPHSRDGYMGAPPATRLSGRPARWSICRRGRSGATSWLVWPCLPVSGPN
jgi:hypothetical protein